MRSIFDKKSWVLLLAVLALGSLTALSVSLKSVSFNDAQQIGWGESSSALGSDADGEVRTVKLVPVELQIGLFISLLILAGLVSLLVSAEARKRFIRLIFRLGVTYWVISYILKEYPEILNLFNPGALSDATPRGTTGEEAVVPPAIFTPPAPTPLLSYVISVLLILVMVFSLWRLYILWKRLNPSSKNRTLSDIARIARNSLRDLSADGNSTDVILKCYFRMSDVVFDKRNLQRDLSTTPAEFALRLEQSGLPGEAVGRLTRLFEGVRYGEYKAGPKEINEAVACLTTILHYCGEPI